MSLAKVRDVIISPHCIVSPFPCLIPSLLPTPRLPHPIPLLLSPISFFLLSCLIFFLSFLPDLIFSPLLLLPYLFPLSHLFHLILSLSSPHSPISSFSSPSLSHHVPLFISPPLPRFLLLPLSSLSSFLLIIAASFTASPSPSPPLLSPLSPLPPFSAMPLQDESVSLVCKPVNQA